MAAFINNNIVNVKIKHLRREIRDELRKSLEYIIIRR